MQQPSRLVGREHELALLRAAWAQTVAGQGGVVTLSGEPGIGKTALSRTFAADVAAAGGRVLTGHCGDSRLFGAPYLPFIEILRDLLQPLTPDQLWQAIADHAGGIGALMPDIWQRLGTTSSPDTALAPTRYRLFQGVAGTLTAAGARQPLLLILEDIHDADQDTLDLVVYVARSLPHSPLLLVATYRDTETSAEHPLVRALRSIRRTLPLQALPLAGLSAAATRELVGHLTGAVRGVDDYAAIVHERTEGHPLFILEVVRGSAQDFVSSAAGRHQPGRLTAGLQEVIGSRLLGLSPICRSLLTVAALVGMQFRLDVVQAVAEVDDAGLGAAVNEAVAARIIEEQRVVGPVAIYRFCHALFQQSLAEGLIAPRRLHLHRRIGLALEQAYGGSVAEHAAELAAHLSHSTDLADRERALNYGEAAARQAMAVYAFSDAVRLLEDALTLLETVNPEDRGRRCDLLTMLCSAMKYAGQPLRAVNEVAPQAYELAIGLADSDRAFLVCQQAHMALTLHGSVAVGPECLRWGTRAVEHARSGTAQQVLANMFLGYAATCLGDRDMATKHTRLAMDIARPLGNPALYWRATSLWMQNSHGLARESEWLALAEEFARGPLPSGEEYVLTDTIWCVADPLLRFGKRVLVESLWQSFRTIADYQAIPNLRLTSLANTAVLATMDGRFQDAQRLSDEIVLLANLEQIGIFSANLEYISTGRALCYQGRAEHLLGSGPIATFPYWNLLILVHAGRHDRAQELIDEYFRHYNSSADVHVQTTVIIIEYATIIGNIAAVERLFPRVSTTTLVTTGTSAISMIGRHLGNAALLIGRPEEARTFYERALTDAIGMRFRPEVALLHLCLAELPDASPEELRAHLDLAIPEFQAMGMAPALARARTLERRLGPAGHPVYPRGLSVREVEVLRLIAGGRTNHQIADALVISERTVARHITNLYAKIDVVNRADATAFALRSGILPTVPIS